MSFPRIGNYGQHVTVSAVRQRETPKPTMTFASVVQGSARLLLSGARAATAVVGMPVLSAAVNEMSPGALGSATVRGGLGGDGGTGGLDGVGRNNGAGSAAGSLEGALNQRMGEEMKLLQIQQDMHRQNMQVSLISNVMKSRHDTAKAAINNIRS